MMESGKEILNRIISQFDNDLKSLSSRLESGGKLIDAEFDESRKKDLMEKWMDLDKAYKRLNLARSVICSPDNEPLQGSYCALCLGLINKDELLQAGWDVKVGDE